MLAISAAVASERNVRLVENRGIGGDFKYWIQQGNFQSLEVSDTYRVTANQYSEFLNAFSGELARLARAGRETLETVRSNRTANTVHPAWSAIQLYYAAFYYASATLRIVGLSTPYFLNGDLLRLRQQLKLQFSDKLPGKGLYRLELSPSGEGFDLKKDPESGTHEALWKLFREYLEGLKGRLPTYGQFEQSVMLEALEQIDVLRECSSGMAQHANLSSTRNEIQYRQGLSCWHPNAREIRQFHRTDRITQALSENFDPKTVILKNTQYADFFTRCLAICGVSHALLTLLAGAGTTGGAARTYMRYHGTLI